MRVVLVFAPVFDLRTPYLGLPYLKASLQRAGFYCRCIDFNIRYGVGTATIQGDREVEEHIASHPELVAAWAEEICSHSPDIVGFTLFIFNERVVRLIAQQVRVRLPNVLIVCGGPTVVREHLEHIRQCLSFADCAIEGEAESILVELVRARRDGKDVRKIQQVWSLGPDGQPVFSGHGQQQAINDIVFPDFSDYRLADYASATRLPILFSRGCIINCTYCTYKWNQATQRTRTGENVFEELMRNAEHHQMDEFIIVDDSLISHITLKELERFADLIIASGKKFSWEIYGTRIDRRLTDPYVEKLARSGLRKARFGVESFSSRVQKDMGKSANHEITDKIIRMFHGAGVEVGVWLIYGYPSESEEDFAVTIDWIRNNSGILADVCGNCFFPNDKYFGDRPGVVTNFSLSCAWQWQSQESTLERRHRRFLRFMDVLEAERRRVRGSFGYSVGDPFYTHYFQEWNDQVRREAEERWRSGQSHLAQMPVEMTPVTVAGP